MRLPDTVLALARRQDQLFSRAQAINRGVAPSLIDRRVRSGELIVVHPGVYRVSPADDTFVRRCRAALLAVAPTAAMARRAAGAIYGVPGVPETVEIAVPLNYRRHLEGVTLLRGEGHLDYGVKYKGLFVHDHARVVIDLAAVLDRDALELAVDHGLRRRWFKLDELHYMLGLRARRGRKGVGVLAEIIAERTDGTPLVMSVFEQRLFRLLREHGVPLPDRQHRVRLPGGASRYLDFAYPALRLAIEAESYEYHSGRQAWSRDRVRQNSLAGLGWTRVDVTWDDLEKRPHDVISWVLAARAAAARPALAG